MSWLIRSALVALIGAVSALQAVATDPADNSAYKDREYTDFLAHHAEQWEATTRNAGHPLGGIVAEACVSPREPEIGKPIMFVVSHRNLNEYSARYMQESDEFGPPPVLMQDDSGKPVPLTEKGRRTWLGPHFGHTGPDFIRVEPGFASSDRLQLDDYFDLSKPGKYTVAHWGAKPVTFNLRGPGSKTTEMSSPADVYRPNDPFAKRWQDALAVAGQSHGDLLVEADLSPTDPRGEPCPVSAERLHFREDRARMGVLRPRPERGKLAVVCVTGDRSVAIRQRNRRHGFIGLSDSRAGRLGQGGASHRQGEELNCRPRVDPRALAPPRRGSRFRGSDARDICGPAGSGVFGARGLARTQARRSCLGCNPGPDSGARAGSCRREQAALRVGPYVGAAGHDGPNATYRYGVADHNPPPGRRRLPYDEPGEPDERRGSPGCRAGTEGNCVSARQEWNLPPHEREREGNYTILVFHGRSRRFFFLADSWRRTSIRTARSPMRAIRCKWSSLSAAALPTRS